MKLKLNFLNGFGGLLRNIGINLAKLTPVYIVLLIAYGDRFLPQPLGDVSRNTRTTINNVFMGAIPKDVLKNNKYNNKTSDKVIEETEKNYGGSKK